MIAFVVAGFVVLVVCIVLVAVFWCKIFNCSKKEEGNEQEQEGTNPDAEQRISRRVPTWNETIEKKGNEQEQEGTKPDANQRISRRVTTKTTQTIDKKSIDGTLTSSVAVRLKKV